jgi:hypothetical protein
MGKIGRGVELSHAGERDAARQLFFEVWSDLGSKDSDPFHRCAVAHAMADVQDDPREELTWDLRALQAADLITDERAALGGVTGGVAGFYPSLHLNIGECYRKLGQLDQAREHLLLGQAQIGALGDDGYGRMISAGLENLAERLAATQ